MIHHDDHELKHHDPGDIVYVRMRVKGGCVMPWVSKEVACAEVVPVDENGKDAETTFYMKEDVLISMREVYRRVRGD